MQFDKDNKIIKLCARGMELEGLGTGEAEKLFLQAWNEASTDFEKFTAAHYVARQQKRVEDKLKWDETALQLALKINDPSIEDALPSLYLNVAKCHEDLDDLPKARENYQLALSHAASLPDNGYGQLIKNGILAGLERVK
jgi:rifampin ADP-ribosylating transferase